MPYLEEIMSIGRADNGYVLTVRVPFEGEEETAPILRDDERQKVIVCKDLDELTTKIGKIIPALSMKVDAKEAFDRAFMEAENE